MLTKNPVLIATPRSGSMIVTKILFNIAHNLFGSKAYLNQFITITPHYKETFDRVDGLITSIEYIRGKNAFHKHAANREGIIKERLELMGTDTRYTTKVFSSDFTPESYQFFKNNFDFVFIERRNKLEQLLSYSTMMTTNKHEFIDGESVKECYFNFDYALQFLIYQSQYARLKRMNPKQPVIYYEDFMNLGGNTEAIQKLLNLPLNKIQEILKINTIKTPYVNNIEDILENKNEWLDSKDTLQKLIDCASKT